MASQMMPLVKMLSSQECNSELLRNRHKSIDGRGDFG